MARNYTDDPTASTTLSASYDSDVNSTLTVTSSAGFPAVPFYAAIKRGLAEQQVVEVTGVTGTTWTVTPVSGTSPTHASGSPIEHVVPAIHFNTIGAHVDATVAHGSGSAIVGKDQVVALTGKTMSGASNTFSAIPQSAVTNLTSDLAALGAWTAFTPSYTNVVLGVSPTNLGRYCTVNNLVIAQYQLTLGTGGDVTGTILPNLPLTAHASALAHVGTAYGSKSTTRRMAAAEFNDTSSLVLVGTDGALWAAAAPFDWAAGDILRIQAMYERA